MAKLTKEQIENESNKWVVFSTLELKADGVYLYLYNSKASKNSLNYVVGVGIRTPDCNENQYKPVLTVKNKYNIDIDKYYRERKSFAYNKKTRDSFNAREKAKSKKEGVDIDGKFSYYTPCFVNLKRALNSINSKCENIEILK